MAVDPNLFQQNLTYTVAASVAEIVQDLGAIARLDQEVEKKQKFWVKLTIGGFAIAFISIFLTGFGGPLALLLLIPALIVGIVGAIQLGRYGRLNIENGRYNLSRQLVTMLERDLEPGTPINASLVFSGATLKTKKVATVPHRFRTDWKVDLFEDSWLKLRGRFTDNTRFQLMMTDLTQTAYGWKRGSSGKSKYKTKTKPKGTEISLTLNCPMRKYGALKGMANLHEAIRLPETARVKRFQVTDKGLYLAVKAPADTSGDRAGHYKTMTMMFLSLYQILNLARMLSKPKSA